MDLNWKRALSLFLCLIMCFSLLPASAFAVNGEGGVEEEEETKTETVITITIEKQPEDAEPKEGEVIFSITASVNTDDVLSYQWQKLDRNVEYEDEEREAAWENMDGETSANLRLTGLDDEEVLAGAMNCAYRCVITAGEAGEKTKEVHVLEPVKDTKGLTRDGNEPPSNSCGANLTWTFDNGVLTISGSGAMYDYKDIYSPDDYPDRDYTPWVDIVDYITALNIGAGVTYIGEFAFQKCAIETAVIGSGTTEIGIAAFWDCGEMRSIDLPDTLERIGVMAFYQCLKLTNITIPEGITSIAAITFYGCTALEIVTIPVTVDTIDPSAFVGCGLTDIYYGGTQEEWQSVSGHDSAPLISETVTIHYGGSAVSSLTVNGVTGSFNDRIKLNYYFDVPQSVRADEAAYVTLTNENTGKTVRLLIKDAEYVAKKGYKFSIPLVAKEASDTITARAFDGRGSALPIRGNLRKRDYTETGVQYSLMQYFTWLGSNGTDSEKAVGAAAKDYCSAAQIYFGYNADNVSVSSAVDAVTAETLSSYIAGREGTLPAGVSIRGITAMFESDNTLRLYLGFSDVDPDSLTYKIDGVGTDLRQRSDGSYYLALAAGVYSNHLQDTHIYSVSDGTNTYSVTASVLTYARSCAIKNIETESNLGKVLYLYNQAAVAAFGQ